MEQKQNKNGKTKTGMIRYVKEKEKMREMENWEKGHERNGENEDVEKWG